MRSNGKNNARNNGNSLKSGPVLTFGCDAVLESFDFLASFRSAGSSIGSSTVMPAQAGIHVFLACGKTWMAGTGPAMSASDSPFCQHSGSLCHVKSPHM